MPILKQKVKRETSLSKIMNNGRLKETELIARGRANYMADASLVCLPYVSQQRRDIQMSFGSPYRSVNR